ncbi:MAG: hypothetical protein QF898_10835 [SAR202 cluster bacterium]|jgi:hypothetical protein|nr:hypothetical protein [SAR202 cluster bacterium]MDP6513873.1 hypothetical protein [SAR202 cluster bacterium]MDP6714095.1 hypothetical protein [SAR202 cluster bacterium]
MPRQKQEGPTRQLYAAIREDLYLAAKARSTELRIPLREFLERAIELALDGESRPVPAQQRRERTVWNDEYISMQAEQPVGSPVELTDEEARALARDAFGNH